jgi:pimeloyl-ACP methyl ester carboxylesterase
MPARALDMPWGRMRLWEAGGGSTAVLALHGLGGSGRYWDGLAEALGDGFRVVAPDLGGFGGSTKPRERADRAFHQASLDALADQVLDGPALVVGHSLGGVLGLLWAARRPAAVTGLVMTASPYPTPHPEWDPARWRGARGWAPRTVVATARATWPVLSLPIQAFGPYPAPVVRDYGRQSIRSRIWTLWSLWGDPSLETGVRSSADEVTRRGTPVLLAHAADDRSVPPASLERWTAILPDAERLVIADGGHQVLLHHRFADVVPWLRVRGREVGGRD